MFHDHLQWSTSSVTFQPHLRSVPTRRLVDNLRNRNNSLQKILKIVQNPNHVANPPDPGQKSIRNNRHRLDHELGLQAEYQERKNSAAGENVPEFDPRKSES